MNRENKWHIPLEKRKKIEKELSDILVKDGREDRSKETLDWLDKELIKAVKQIEKDENNPKPKKEKKVNSPVTTMFFQIMWACYAPIIFNGLFPKKRKIILHKTK